MCLDMVDQASEDIIRSLPVNISQKQIPNTLRRLELNMDYDFFDVRSVRKQKLSCFFIYPKFRKAHDIIFYLHSNGSCKYEALSCLQSTKDVFSILSFDFSGCGQSEGEFITYGINQKQDILAVYKEAKAKFNIKTVTLWGKSMGAVCAIKFLQLVPEQLISCVVLDSPFKSLQKTIKNVGFSRGFSSLTMSVALFFIKRRIKDSTELQIFQQDYAEAIKSLKVKYPVLFIGSCKDEVVLREDVYELFQIYKGPKEFMEISIKHSEKRQKGIMEEVGKYIMRHTLKKSFIKIL